MTTFHIITLFPQSLDSYLNESILKRAQEDKKISIKFYNPRDFAENKWDRVDNKPYGGGPGMIIEALPVIKAIAKALGKKKISAKGGKNAAKIIWLSPSGTELTNNYSKKVAEKFSDIVIVCGRYEGIDARVQKVFKTEEVSIGPYVITGGEIGAMIIVDTVSRQIPGVLGNFDSLEESRASSPDVYTRPEVIVYKKKKLRVPKVLLSGHQKNIDLWKTSVREKRSGKGKSIAK